MLYVHHFVVSTLLLNDLIESARQMKKSIISLKELGVADEAAFFLLYVYN